MSSNEYEYLKNNSLAGDINSNLTDDFNEEELGFWGHVGDIAMGIPRGVAGAAEAVLELPTVFGLDYDIPDNFGLGESETVAGGIVDGIINFGAGFAMGGGVAGLAMASKLRNTGKVGKALMGGKYRQELATASLQGMATDALFFKGDEGRLSDLIQSAPSLANPISEFLSTEEDDWEITGRLKNAVEGLGIGFAVDSLLIGLRALKAKRKKYEETGDINEANKEAQRIYEDEELAPWMESFDLSRDEAVGVASLADAFGLTPDVMTIGTSPGGERLFQIDAEQFFHKTFRGLDKFDDNMTLAQAKKAIGGKQTEWAFTGLDLVLKENPNIKIGEAKKLINQVEIKEVIASDNIEPKFDRTDHPHRMDAMFIDKSVHDLIQDSIHHGDKPQNILNLLMKNNVLANKLATDGASILPELGIDPIQFSARNKYVLDKILVKKSKAKKGETNLTEEEAKRLLEWTYGESYENIVKNLTQDPVRFKDYSPNNGEGLINYREMRLDWNNMSDDIVDIWEMNPAMDSHYGPQTMVHARFHDEFTEDGQRILNVFEVQSDWARNVSQRFEEAPPMSDVDQTDPLVIPAGQDYPDRWAIDDYGDSVFPDFPLRKNWPEHMVERLLKLAAEEGYDGIRFSSVEEIRQIDGLSPSLDSNLYTKRIPRAIQKLSKKHKLNQSDSAQDGIIAVKKWKEELDSTNAIIASIRSESASIRPKIENANNKYEEWSLLGRTVKKQAKQFDKDRLNFFRVLTDYKQGRGPFEVILDAGFTPTRAERIKYTRHDAETLIEEINNHVGWKRIQELFFHQNEKGELPNGYIFSDGIGTVVDALHIKNPTKSKKALLTALENEEFPGKILENFRELMESLQNRSNVMGQTLLENPNNRTVEFNELQEQLLQNNNRQSRLVRKGIELEKNIASGKSSNTFFLDGDRFSGSRGSVLTPSPLFQSVTRNRNLELQQAAKELEAGKLTAKEYQDLVDELKPVIPYNHIPKSATRKEMDGALKGKQKERVNAKVEEGATVGLRLDIPAYSRHGVWVPTIHDAGSQKPISHRAVAVINNATFGSYGKKALKVAQGGGKSPFAVIEGGFENSTIKATRAEAEAALNDPDWVQVGFDPERHDFYYDRATQEPIVEAERVIQVGPLVLAKRAKKGNKGDFLYQDEGKVDPYTTAKGVTEFGEDGKAFIRGLNNPDISTAVHELGHVVRRRFYELSGKDGGFTPDERRILDNWAGAEDGKWNVDAEEKFARAFERYLMEGEAPSFLKNAFAKIANAMRNIYNRIKGSAVDVEMPDNVKKVFDDLFERSADRFKTSEANIAPKKYVWSAERLDRHIKDDDRAEGSVGAIAFMNPLDFVRASTGSEKMFNKIMEESEKWFSKGGRYGELDLNLLEREVDVFNTTPGLTLWRGSDESGSLRIREHEGRHRMAAMHLLGITEVPVHLGYSGSKDNIEHAVLNIKGQHWWEGATGKDVDVMDVIPLTNANRENILQRMRKGEEKPQGSEQPLFQQGENAKARQQRKERRRQRAPEYNGQVIDPETGEVVYLNSTASELGEVYTIPKDLEGRPDLVSDEGDDTARDLFIKARDLHRARKDAPEAISYEEKLIEAEQRAHTIFETANVQGTEALAEIVTSGHRMFEDSLTNLYALQDVEAALLRQHTKNIRQLREITQQGQKPTSEQIARAMIVEKQLGETTTAVVSNMEALARAFASRKRRGKGSAIQSTDLSGKYIDGIENEEYTKLLSALESGKVDGDTWYEQTVVAIEKGDVEAMRVANKRHKLGWGHIFLEAYYGSLLSGVKTQTVNTMGSWINTVIMPLEKLIGRGLVADADGKAQLAFISNLPRQALESIEALKVAFRTSSSQLDPGGMSSLADATGMHSGATDVAGVAGISDSMAGTIVNWAHNNITKLPLRALGSMDEFSKQLNYRAHVLTELTSKAKEVHPTDGVAQQKWVEKQFGIMTEKGQMYNARNMWNKAQRMATDEIGQTGDDAKYLIRERANEIFKDLWDNDLGNVAKEGLRIAREATFTTRNDPNLGANTLSRGIQGAGAGLQRLLARHPVGRLIVPFVNTPTNLATWFVDRQFSPLFDTAKLIKSKLKPEWDQAIYGGDPIAKADAIGRLATGSAMSIIAMSAIASGKLTGGGPKEKRQRQIWLEAGNQPYSLKVGDGWVSYKRLDPWASFLGVQADLMEGLAHYNEEGDSTLVEDILQATLLAFSRNLTEKTYLQGIVQATQALTNPDVYGEKWVRGFASAGMPTLIKDLNSDPYYREINSFKEQWLSRTPGMSDGLMPRRDVLGAPIEKPSYFAPDGLEFMSPFAYTQVKSDIVKQELAAREHGFSPPQSIKNGVDLSELVKPSGQTAHDRWQELHGTVKLNGKTLKQALEKLIKSPRYQRMIESPDYDPRVAELRKILSKYRSRAYRELEKEFPELLQSRIHQKRMRAAARRGEVFDQILNY